MNSTVWHIRIFLLAVILLLVCPACYAQEDARLTQFVQLNSIFSFGDNAPFWLTANKQGISSLNSNNGYVRYGIVFDSPIGKTGQWRYRIAGELLAGKFKSGNS